MASNQLDKTPVEYSLSIEYDTESDKYQYVDYIDRNILHKHGIMCVCYTHKNKKVFTSYNDLKQHFKKDCHIKWRENMNNNIHNHYRYYIETDKNLKGQKIILGRLEVENSQLKYKNKSLEENIEKLEDKIERLEDNKKLLEDEIKIKELKNNLKIKKLENSLEMRKLEYEIKLQEIKDKMNKIIENLKNEIQLKEKELQTQISKNINTKKENRKLRNDINNIRDNINSINY